MNAPGMGGRAGQWAALPRRYCWRVVVPSTQFEWCVVQVHRARTLELGSSSWNQHEQGAVWCV